MSASPAILHQPAIDPFSAARLSGSQLPDTSLPTSAMDSNHNLKNVLPNGRLAPGETPADNDTSETLQAKFLPSYALPDGKLKTTIDDSSKTPLLLVACGSFSPITYLHLRMFDMVADHAKFNTDFEVIGGYFSPVSDAYKKKGLASAEHRIHMCDIACDPAPWLMVDPWEAYHENYLRTALVLDHFHHEINIIRQGVATKDGDRKQVRIALLAGADLIGTMSTPGVWSNDDLDHILGKYGAFIIERMGTDIEEALVNLQKWKDNIWVIPQLIQNDVSSTKIRSFLDRKMSVNYLIPAPVIKYIEQHGLYEDGSLQRRENSTS